MDIKQAYKILEIPVDSSFTAIREAYRDLAKVWHPDRHSHNERLHRKAQEKMRELNEAYELICLHHKTDDSSGFQHEGEREEHNSTENIVVCLRCGTKNRIFASANYLLARCGRCGSHLFDDNPKQQYERTWQDRRPCGDGACVGIIDSAGRCTRCSRTFEEGVAAEREATEARRRDQIQKDIQARRKNKRSLYAIAGIGVLFVVFTVFQNFISHSGDKRKSKSNSASTRKPVRKNDQPMPSAEDVLAQMKKEGKGEVPRAEDVLWERDRLRTGATLYARGIRSGESEITVENGTDVDAVVRVVRFRGSGHQIVRDFYIRTHDSFVADRIPPGKYVLKIGFGTDWNTEARKFNYPQAFSETQSFMVEEERWTESRDDGEVEHTRASQLSITLHKVIGGNFQTHPITEDEFWR